MLLKRTFHPDEANQAFTVGRLLETGNYTYKPADHHGPTLYYAAAPLQKAFGNTATADLNPTLLRCTPLIFAILSLIFIFLAIFRLLKSQGLSPSPLSTLNSALKSQGLSPSPLSTLNFALKSQGLSPSPLSTLNSALKSQGLSSSPLSTLNSALKSQGLSPSHSPLSTLNSALKSQGLSPSPLSTLNSALISIIPVVLLATSPMFAFYATDFIQEMLLVSFTIMMAWAAIGYFIPSGKWVNDTFIQTGKFKRGTWALLFGIAAGLAFSTKETSILSFISIITTSIPFLLTKRTGTDPVKIGDRPHEYLGTDPVKIGDRPHEYLGLTTKKSGTVPVSDMRISHLVLLIMGFILTSFTLFSSFCQDWTGVYNAFVVAPLNYLGRAVGDAASSEGANWHIHPWWQYLQWLFLGSTPITKSDGFTIATHAFANLQPLIHLLFLSLPIGIFLVIKKRKDCILNIFLWLSLYTTLMLVFYSLIPYKTPWCTLQILVPFILSVSFGYIITYRAIRELVVARGWGQSLHISTCICALVFLVALPAWTILQEHIPGLVRINRDPDSQAIPYNYAHASPEVNELAKCVADAIDASKSSDAFIAVAIPPCDTWPFPWYNRKLESITGYWKNFEDLIVLQKTGKKPTVVLVPMSQGHLVQPLFPHLKHTKRFYMRPGVRIRVFW